MPKETTPKKNKGGRPKGSGRYRKEFNEQAYKLCLLGADDKKLADFFNVTEQTINNWKKAQPSFFESLKAGKEVADAKIAESLYHRAKGYTHDDVHISNYQGQITITPLKKHYPPDTTAAIFWLKNRQKGEWRDKKDREITGKDGGPIEQKWAGGPPTPQTIKEWEEQVREADKNKATSKEKQ